MSFNRRFHCSKNLSHIHLVELREKQKFNTFLIKVLYWGDSSSPSIFDKIDSPHLLFYNIPEFAFKHILIVRASVSPKFHELCNGRV